MNSDYDFNAAKHTDLYQTEAGPKLWSFLNDPISIARMQAVSDVGKPALLGVERGLINEFKIHAWADAEGKAKYDRLKQMIGAMVKQIMERTGYRLKSSNVKVPTSTIFYSTSLYTMDN